MSNLNSKENLQVISMPIDETFFTIITKGKNTLHKEQIIITGITEKEYYKIKENKEIEIIRGNHKFIISPDNVFCFGEIDFHENSEDCKILDTFNWFSELGIQGIPVPSRYNYDKHECVSPNKCYMWTETFIISVFCRYLHGRLNKPHYTLIFKKQ